MESNIFINPIQVGLICRKLNNTLDYLEKILNVLGLHHIKFMLDRSEDVKEYFDKLGFDIEVLNRIRDGE